MTSVLKGLLIAVTLVAGAGTALADAGGTYHWGYPDSLKDRPNIPVRSLDVGSGIPPLYR